MFSPKLTEGHCRIFLKTGAAHEAHVLSLCGHDGVALNHLDPVVSSGGAAVM